MDCAKVNDVENNKSNLPYAKIIIDPSCNEKGIRYKCKRNANQIEGEPIDIYDEKVPSIQVFNYKGPVQVLVSCVEKEKPFYPHPHGVIAKERETKCGVCFFNATNPKEMTITFPQMGIEFVKSKNMKKALQVRKKLQVDPFKTGYRPEDEFFSVDLNCLRLCFQVHLQGSKEGVFDVPLPPLVSEKIYEKPEKSEPTINFISHIAAPVSGDQEICILCDKEEPDDVVVRFFEKNSDWQAFAELTHPKVFKKVSVVFKSPRYPKQDIIDPVEVFVQLKRISDGEASDPLTFMFLPLEHCCNTRKRKREYVNMIINDFNQDATPPCDDAQSNDDGPKDELRQLAQISERSKKLLDMTLPCILQTNGGFANELEAWELPERPENPDGIVGLAAMIAPADVNSILELTRKESNQIPIPMSTSNILEIDANESNDTPQVSEIPAPPADTLKVNESPQMNLNHQNSEMNKENQSSNPAQIQHANTENKKTTEAESPISESSKKLKKKKKKKKNKKCQQKGEILPCDSSQNQQSTPVDACDDQNDGKDKCSEPSKNLQMMSVDTASVVVNTRVDDFMEISQNLDPQSRQENQLKLHNQTPILHQNPIPHPLTNQNVQSPANTWIAQNFNENTSLNPTQIAAGNNLESALNLEQHLNQPNQRQFQVQPSTLPSKNQETSRIKAWVLHSFDNAKPVNLPDIDLLAKLDQNLNQPQTLQPNYLSSVLSQNQPVSGDKIKESSTSRDTLNSVDSWLKSLLGTIDSNDLVPLDSDKVRDMAAGLEREFASDQGIQAPFCNGRSINNFDNSMGVIDNSGAGHIQQSIPCSYYMNILGNSESNDPNNQNNTPAVMNTVDLIDLNSQGSTTPKLIQLTPFRTSNQPSNQAQSTTQSTLAIPYESPNFDLFGGVTEHLKTESDKKKSVDTALTLDEFDPLKTPQNGSPSKCAPIRGSLNTPVFEPLDVKVNETRSPTAEIPSVLFPNL